MPCVCVCIYVNVSLHVYACVCASLRDMQVFCAVESMATMLLGHQEERCRQEIGGRVDPLRLALIGNCLSCNYLNK